MLRKTLSIPRNPGKVSSANDETHQKTLLFKVFCGYALFLLCRPQDWFTLIAVFHPAMILFAITLILILVNRGELNANSFFGEKQNKRYATLVFIMIVGIPFALYPRRAFTEIFTHYINIVFFFFVFFKLVNTIQKLRAALFILCLGSGLYSVFSIASNTLGQGRLFFGTMFDPNDLAYFTICFLPINLIFFSKNNSLWKRIVCMGSFGTGILLILLTASRGGTLALGVIACIFLFSKSVAVKTHIKIIAILLGFAIFSYAPIDTERIKTLANIKEDYNTWDETGRISIWKIGIRAMLERPMTGVGVTCFSEAVGLDRERRGIEIRRWQAAHNSVVQIGTETGVVGLLLFLLMSYDIFRIFYRTRKNSNSEILVKISEVGWVGFLGLFVSGFFLSQAYSAYWAFYVVYSSVVSRLMVIEKAHGGTQNAQ